MERWVHILNKLKGKKFLSCKTKRWNFFDPSLPKNIFLISVNIHRVNKIWAHLKKNKVIKVNCFTVPGAFTNNVDTFLALFDHLPHYIVIFYLINVGNKKTSFESLDYLPTSCFLFFVFCFLFFFVLKKFISVPTFIHQFELLHVLLWYIIYVKNWEPLLVIVVCKRPLSLLKFEPRTHTIFLQLFSFSAFQYSGPFVIHRRCSWTLPWIQCHVLLRVHVFFHGETWLECSHESRWTWCIWRTIWQPLITHPTYS